MQRPDNIDDALRQLHHLTMSIAMDISKFMDDDQMQYDSDYFADMKAAALDAHLLVTWVKDNFKEMHK
jgi:hypothetical protein